MNGPEHYAEAQRILDEDVDYSQPDDLALVLAHAQVHATLAVAAGRPLIALAHRIEELSTRGGTRFTVEGEMQEVRVHLLRSFEDEVPVLSLSNIALLLRADR